MAMPGTTSPNVDELVDKALSLKPAPAPLDRVQVLLNTRNLLDGYDLLSDDTTVGRTLALLAQRRGDPAPPGYDHDAVTALIDVREAIRDLLLAHSSGVPPESAVVQRLRAAGSTVLLAVEFDDSGDPVMAPPGSSRGIERIAADAMAAVASADADQRRRLKACVNPGCGWVFFDTSRSRSGTWCAMNVCGARHKMERYRGKRT
jgi:predicted RNA-binding Zn ribbon-like protein